MKRVIYLLCFLAVSSFAHAQSDENPPAQAESTVPVSAEPSIEGVKIPLPSASTPEFLVHAPYSLGAFYTIGEKGKWVSYKKLNEMLLTVPGNERLVRSAQGLRISAWTSYGISAAAYTLLILDTLHVWPETRWVTITTALTGVLAMTTGVILDLFSVAAYNNAVDNHNLYIMGLPIAFE